jgi:hypothetical protein
MFVKELVNNLQKDNEVLAEGLEEYKMAMAYLVE